MATDEIFEKALSFVLPIEGGYVNDPDDKGGATNKGITQSTYDSYLQGLGLPKKDVRNITDAEVKKICYSRYWLSANCHKMTDKFAVICFDTAVNMGVSRVKEFLNACQYTDIDGFFLARIKKYNSFARVKSQQKYLHGWLNRTFALRDFIYKM